MGIRAILRLPDFRRLWIAQAISDFGDGLTLLTLMLLVNTMTGGSTLALAAVAIALAIPPVTIGLVAGTYVDRWDRRKIMIVSDSLRAVVVLGFAFIHTSELLPLVLVLAFVQATIGPSSARPAAPSSRVSSRPRASSPPTRSARRRGSSPASSAARWRGSSSGVAGLTWPAFVLDALTFAASAIIIVGVARELGRPSGAERCAPPARGPR